MLPFLQQAAAFGQLRSVETNQPLRLCGGNGNDKILQHMALAEAAVLQSALPYGKAWHIVADPSARVFSVAFLPRPKPRKERIRVPRLDGGKLLTAGGRVLGVTATADTLKDAVDCAYKNVEKVHFGNAFYRRDIGKRALLADPD